MQADDQLIRFKTQKCFEEYNFDKLCMAAPHRFLYGHSVRTLLYGLN